jgi:hypothetical protein
MTRRARLWISAVLTIAASALMVGLTITAQAGVNQTPTHPALAGITATAVDGITATVDGITASGLD